MDSFERVGIDKSMPTPPSIEEYKWNLFGEDITLFLKYPRVPERIEKSAIDNLKLVDKVLADYQESLSDSLLLEGLYEAPDKLIKESDIFINFLNFMIDYCKKLSSEEIKYYERLDPDRGGHSSVAWNVVKDLRRVINRRLNNEPLYLIPKQFNLFMNFTRYLFSAPRNTLL